MSGTTSLDPYTLLKLPPALARDLLDQGLVRPYIRHERVDTTLLPAVVIAVSSAAATVVTTKITEEIARAIARSITSWRRRQHEEEEIITLVVQDSNPANLTELPLSCVTTEADIVQELLRVTASDDRPKTTDDHA